MSEIKRYDVDVNYQRENWSLEEFESGDLVKYEDHAAIVTQLETDLAEARKDQARYQYMRKLNVPQFQKIFMLNLSSDIRFDECIDVAIKEQ